MSFSKSLEILSPIQAVHTAVTEESFPGRHWLPGVFPEHRGYLLWLRADCEGGFLGPGCSQVLAAQGQSGWPEALPVVWSPQSFSPSVSTPHPFAGNRRLIKQRGRLGLEGGDLLPLCVLISPLASNPAHILISVKGHFFFLRQTFLMLNEDRNPGQKPIGPLRSSVLPALSRVLRLPAVAVSGAYDLMFSQGSLPPCLISLLSLGL